MLGEGEVSIQVKGSAAGASRRACSPACGAAARSMPRAGCWRDWLEAGAVPEVALDAARAAAAAGLPAVEWPAGAMNSPALVAEIGSQLQTRDPAARAHVINLTLFPMTPDDHAVLERALPVGPGGDDLARLRQLPRHVHADARRLARAVLQRHEHADPEHAGGGRRARGGAGRRPKTWPTAASGWPSWCSGWTNRWPSTPRP